MTPGATTVHQLTFARLDAGGTRLRLRALHVMGHGSARISRALRVREETIQPPAPPSIPPRPPPPPPPPDPPPARPPAPPPPPTPACRSAATGGKAHDR